MSITSGGGPRRPVRFVINFFFFGFFVFVFCSDKENAITENVNISQYAYVYSTLVT
jgi:hypothetical protein